LAPTDDLIRLWTSKVQGHTMDKMCGGKDINVDAGTSKFMF